MRRRNFTNDGYPYDPMDVSDRLWLYTDKKGLCVVMRRPGKGIELDHVPWSVVKKALADHQKARSRRYKQP
jgi:hypothetical protein